MRSYDRRLSRVFDLRSIVLRSWLYGGLSLGKSRYDVYNTKCVGIFVEIDQCAVVVILVVSNKNCLALWNYILKH